MRIALLVIGVLIIAAVYFFGIGPQRKRNARRLAGGRTRGYTLPQAPEAEAELATLPVAEDDTEVRALDDDDLRDLPAVRHEPDALNAAAGARRTAPQTPAQLQMELQLDASLIAAPPAELAVAEQTPELIILYLRAGEDERFSRERLLGAFREVGLKFGDRRIFHHFGVGAMQGELPLFSVANMFEPGHLDVNAPADLATSGLALFLQLPARIEGAIAFELYLSTADRLARLLDARLLSESHRELTPADIERMRARVSLSSAA
jgi:cell division protein ZipA